MKIIREISTYDLPEKIVEIKKEIDIYSMVYWVIGSLLEKYPENYNFEITSRLLRLYDVKPYITCLIKQLDKQSIQYCSLIVPYCQIEPPGGGLLQTYNRHTSSVICLKLTDDFTTAISLSDRIVVINLETNKTVLDIYLPKLNQSYLNCTLLSNIDSNNKNDKFKNLLFFLYSFNNIYLISANEDIKFSKSSQIGYLSVEIFDINPILCIITEINGNYVECWDIFKNELFDRIEFPSSSSTIKYVFCVKMHSMIITVFHNGNIYFHSIIDSIKSNFTYRGSIKVGNHLDLVTIDNDILICTFDSTIQTEFAFINLNQFEINKNVLNDNQILKILMNFDHPLESKFPKKIILPCRDGIDKKEFRIQFPLFIVLTNGWLYVIHLCRMQTISYATIKGQFDMATTHVKNLNLVYTARGGIIQLHMWTCSDTEHQNNFRHKYQLYVSIDVGSSPVTAIYSAPGYGKFFFYSIYS